MTWFWQRIWTAAEVAKENEFSYDTLLYWLRERRIECLPREVGHGPDHQVLFSWRQRRSIRRKIARVRYHRAALDRELGSNR